MGRQVLSGHLATHLLCDLLSHPPPVSVEALEVAVLLGLLREGAPAPWPDKEEFREYPELPSMGWALWEGPCTEGR